MQISALQRGTGAAPGRAPPAACRGQDPNHPGSVGVPLTPGLPPGTLRLGGCGKRRAPRPLSAPPPKGLGMRGCGASLPGGAGGSLTSLQGDPQRDPPAGGCRRGSGLPRAAGGSAAGRGARQHPGGWGGGGTEGGTGGPGRGGNGERGAGGRAGRAAGGAAPPAPPGCTVRSTRGEEEEEEEVEEKEEEEEEEGGRRREAGEPALRGSAANFAPAAGAASQPPPQHPSVSLRGERQNVSLSVPHLLLLLLLFPGPSSQPGGLCCSSPSAPIPTRHPPAPSMPCRRGTPARLPQGHGHLRPRDGHTNSPRS
eukprot:XP_027309353.1 uncharacterized protein LOC113843111 [Anas platyrhynchos]